MELSSDQIKQIIPHRYPFLLVDKIVEMEPGQSARGVKCVSVNEPFFCGHFPEYAVMPGVLIIEALAQVGAVAILSVEEHKGKIALFGGIKNARFKRQVVPGDVLELKFGEKLIRVEVLSTDAVWFGVTNPQDKAQVMAELQKLHQAGAYPPALD